MKENEKKTSGWKKIAGGILLIAVLFVGVELTFWGLEQAIPQERWKESSSAVSSQEVPEDGAPAPRFCTDCGEELPESFQWGQFCPWCGEKIEK